MPSSTGSVPEHGLPVEVQRQRHSLRSVRSKQFGKLESYPHEPAPSGRPGRQHLAGDPGDERAAATTWRLPASIRCRPACSIDGLTRFKALVPMEGGVTWDQAVCIAANFAAPRQRPEVPPVTSRGLRVPGQSSRWPGPTTAWCRTGRPRAHAAARRARAAEPCRIWTSSRTSSWRNLSPRKDPANRGAWLECLGEVQERVSGNQHEDNRLCGD